MSKKSHKSFHKFMLICCFRAELVEREGMLRTKAMREREQERERRRYRYSLVRVRFPDGLVLQVGKPSIKCVAK